MNHRILFALIWLLPLSCSTSHRLHLGKAAKYYPSTNLLSKGLAVKYYEKYIPNNPDANTSIDVSYLTYELSEPGILVLKSYNTAFQKKWKTTYLVEEGRFIIRDKYYYTIIDTVKTEVKEMISEDWTGAQAVEKFTLSLNGWVTTYNRNQSRVSDTIVDKQLCKKIDFEKEVIYTHAKQDTTIRSQKSSRIYSEGIGLYQQIIKQEKATIHSFLVEQMPLTEFKKRANHNKKRIAYINPKQTLDNHSDFNLCNSEMQIGDYYGCDHRVQLKGGKGAWWRILNEKVNSEKLNNESGYLTYRFVVNCEGETGRFITEEADLDFNKKEFDKNTVKHLYEIVYAQKDWQACHRTERTKDSYTYLTFKLKDGKIIELLP